MKERRHHTLRRSQRRPLQFVIRYSTFSILLEATGPLKFLGNPCVRALFSDPGGTFAPGQELAEIGEHSAARRCGLPLLVQRRLPRIGSFEAPWHGPHTRCLRFAGRIAPPPRKTRFRPLARLCRTGCCLLQGSNERFQLHALSLSASHPPFPSFLDAS